ncbi:MAG: HlyC/CorC family transporter [Mycoplasmataceae bacterium]|nr:HlyC/CorC family transporter [Mycoplasmataceae bacterium]
MNWDLFLKFTIGIVLILLIVLSALFSFSEMAITSSNTIKLKLIVDDENSSKQQKRQAKRVIHFIKNYNEHISSIVIFNNIVNILTTTLATVYFTELTGKSIGPIVAFLIMTPLVIIFGEIIPKQLAKKFPEIGTMKLSWTLQIVNMILRPFTFLLSRLVKQQQTTMLNSDEEIHMALDEATKAGVTSSFEQQIIRRSLELDKTFISEVMIPRDQVITIPSDMDKNKLSSFLKNNSHTRFPITDDTGKIVKIFSAKRYLIDELNDISEDLSKYNLVFTTFSLDDNPFQILESLRNRREKMAIILNEGKFVGIITIEDIVESLFGGIYDEDDVEKDGVYKLNDTSFIVSPFVNVGYLFDKYIESEKLEKVFRELEISKFVKEFSGKELKNGDYITYKNIIIWAKEDLNVDKKITYEIDVVDKTKEIDND